MASGQAASAVALALVALVGLVGAARLDVGGVTQPGPGFFPLVLSLGLLLVSGVLFVAALRAGRGVAALHGEPATAASPEEPAAVVTDAGMDSDRSGRWRLAATLGALTVHVLLFERVGFVTATAGLLAFLFAALGRYRWRVALGAAVVIAFAARVVFDRWLQVRLPPDFWGR